MDTTFYAKLSFFLQSCCRIAKKVLPLQPQTYGNSSVGRALVSKTRCREFEPLFPCSKRCIMRYIFFCVHPLIPTLSWEEPIFYVESWKNVNIGTKTPWKSVMQWKNLSFRFESPWKQTRITTSGTRLCHYFQSKRCIKRYIFFCQNFLPCKAGVYFGGQTWNRDEIADFCDNPLISSFQLEKIIFPVGNIFFPNWAPFSPQLPDFYIWPLKHL